MNNRYLVVFFILSMTVSGVLAAPTVSVVPSSVSVKVGDTFTASISISPNGNEIYGAQFLLNFDKKIINAISISEGKFLTQDGNLSFVIAKKCDNTTGMCEYAEARYNTTLGMNNSGILAAITFKAIAAGQGSLQLTDVILSDTSGNQISGVNSYGGSVNIQGSTSGGGTSSSSGGGGGGGTSGEDFKNIEKQDRKDAFVYAGKLTSIQFSDAGPIESINFTGKKNLGEITAQVEVLKNTSSLVNQTPPGAVYRNINIWLGTSGFARPENIENPVVRFKVENVWLSSNNFAAGDVALLRWNNSVWSRLETIQVGKNDMYTFFDARTDHFSPFSISAKKSTQSGAATLPVNTERIQDTSGTSEAQDKKIPGFESVSIMATLIALLYMFSRKR